MRRSWSRACFLGCDASKGGNVVGGAVGAWTRSREVRFVSANAREPLPRRTVLPACSAMHGAARRTAPRPTPASTRAELGHRFGWPVQLS
jgi:hypothetical protein